MCASLLCSYWSFMGREIVFLYVSDSFTGWLLLGETTGDQWPVTNTLNKSAGMQFAHHGLLWPLQRQMFAVTNGRTESGCIYANHGKKFPACQPICGRPHFQIHTIVYLSNLPVFRQIALGQALPWFWERIKLKQNRYWVFYLRWSAFHHRTKRISIGARHKTRNWKELGRYYQLSNPS